MCDVTPHALVALCLVPAEHLHLPRSLDHNYLTGDYGEDMSGVIKLAEMLPRTKLQSLR